MPLLHDAYVKYEEGAQWLRHNLLPHGPDSLGTLKQAAHFRDMGKTSRWIHESWSATPTKEEQARAFVGHERAKYRPEHDALVSHIFGHQPTTDEMDGRTARTADFGAVADGLAKAANKMVGANVLDAKQAGKLVALGRDLLKVGMAQADAVDPTSLADYENTISDAIKPYAAYAGTLGSLMTMSGVTGKIKGALIPYMARYGRLASYIARGAQAGNLSAASTAILVFYQAWLAEAMAEAHNAISSTQGAPLSERQAPAYRGYQVGDWVTARYQEGGRERLNFGLVVAAGPNVRVAMLSTSEIGEYPLTDLAFVSQDKFNMLTASDAKLDAWVHIVLAKQAESVRVPEDVSNLPARPAPELNFGCGPGGRRLMGIGDSFRSSNENVCGVPEEKEEPAGGFGPGPPSRSPSAARDGGRDPREISLTRSRSGSVEKFRHFNPARYAFIGSPGPAVQTVVGQELDFEGYARAWILANDDRIQFGIGPELEQELHYETAAGARQWGPLEMVPDDSRRVVYWHPEFKRVMMKSSVAVRPHRDHPTWFYYTGNGKELKEDSGFARFYESGPKHSVERMQQDVRGWVDEEGARDEREKEDEFQEHVHDKGRPDDSELDYLEGHLAKLSSMTTEQLQAEGELSAEEIMQEIENLTYRLTKWGRLKAAGGGSGALIGVAALAALAFLAM